MAAIRVIEVVMAAIRVIEVATVAIRVIEVVTAVRFVSGNILPTIKTFLIPK
jgi:hypothetical protein